MKNYKSKYTRYEDNLKRKFLGYLIMGVIILVVVLLLELLGVIPPST